MSHSNRGRPGGIICPIVTPLTTDDRLDEPVFRALIDALVPDLDGLFVLGSSGELTWLPDEIAIRVAQVAVDQVGGRVPVYVGVGDTGGSRTLARLDRFAAIGADYLVCTAPFYYAVASEARLVDHFTTIAERAAAPLILYNIPQNTHLALTPSVVRALAPHPNIVGIKDSAGDWFAFEQFLGLRSDGFAVMQGRERLAAISFWSGADGLISAMANFAPRLLRAVADGVRDDASRALILAEQATIGALAGVFDQGDWLAGLKCTLQTLGWPVGEPNRPIAPSSAAERRSIERIVTSADIRPWLTIAPEPASAKEHARA